MSIPDRREQWAQDDRQSVRSVYHVGVNNGHKMIVNPSGRCTTSASSYGPSNRVQDADEEIVQIDVNNGFLVSGNPSSKLLGLEGSKFLEICALSLCPYNFSCRPNPNKRRFLCSLASPSSIGTRGPNVPRKKSGRL
ncbi:hypothetical protein LOK49_LG14G01138 [Camellia lanceoleosa]|uniref:Uncharacterized protein n=1 Tax=Camellia lanceoleosa TaxID=1840588 RepID=A0ACC0FA89_9ERIC|nr:hypothetical protein LOK49_LG14G01138 [Camellia lanceoleosa]